MLEQFSKHVFVEVSVEGSHALTAGAQREIADWLGIIPRRRVLDVGCGGAAPFARVCAAAGARVCAVDASARAIDEARAALRETPRGATVALARADVLALPFVDASFDVVWCSRVLHHLRRPVDAARELARVTRSGGSLAIREGGPPLRMLPFDIGRGEPGLEDRLQAVHARWFAAMQRDTLGGLPYPHGWTRLLREAGLEDVRVRTFLTEALPPFTPTIERWLAKQLQRALDWDRGPYGPFLDEADRATLREISDPASPHYALRRDDLHVLVGDTVYAGRRTAR